MSQIKVTDTRMHKVSYPTNYFSGHFDKMQDVPVAEAKLVLVEQPYDYKPIVGTIGFGEKQFKPILISETEKIEVGDWVLRPDGVILKMTNNDYVHYLESESTATKKILALPEHFSPKHLQAIVDSKMKDQDKVLVECERKYHTGEEWVFQIKLNSQSHITLHKVEEKKYTGREIEIAFLVGILNRVPSVDQLSIELQTAQEKIDKLKLSFERGDFNAENHESKIN